MAIPHASHLLLNLVQMITSLEQWAWRQVVSESRCSRTWHLKDAVVKKNKCLSMKTLQIYKLKQVIRCKIHMDLWLQAWRWTCLNWRAQRWRQVSCMYLLSTIRRSSNGIATSSCNLKAHAVALMLRTSTTWTTPSRLAILGTLIRSTAMHLIALE